MILLDCNVIKKTFISITPDNYQSVLLLNDYLYGHARSKSVEMIALVHDHATGHFVRGSRLLTYGQQMEIPSYRLLSYY